MRRLLLPLLLSLLAATVKAEDEVPGPGLTLHQEALALPATGAATAPELRLRWWVRQGRADLGWGLRSESALAPQYGPLANPGGDAAAGWRPMLSMGWQGRGGHASLLADLPGNADQGGTRVAVEWTPAKQLPMNLRDGLLGVRLDSGYRVSLKPRRGGLGVYMRGQF